MSYEQSLKDEAAVRLLDASDATLVFSYPTKLSKDGDKWCVLLGENLQEGYAVFGVSPSDVVNQMRAFIYSGKDSK